MTSMIRFSPSTELRRLQREIDQIFNGMYPGAEEDAETMQWTPRVDLSETDDAYLIHMDVPGIKREDLEINYQDGTLTIRGHRQESHEEERGSVVRMERSYGRFFRSFSLPTSIQTENISASYEDGVLKINVPKAEESKPKRIELS